MVNLRSEMQQWLHEKNINFELTWMKVVLFDLIKKNKGQPTYALDELLKATTTKF